MYSCMKRTSCFSKNCVNYKEVLLYILQYLYNLYLRKKRERIIYLPEFISFRMNLQIWFMEINMKQKQFCPNIDHLSVVNGHVHQHVHPSLYSLTHRNGLYLHLIYLHMGWKILVVFLWYWFIIAEFLIFLQET